VSRICLDTSAYSNYRRGQPLAVDLIDQAEWIGVPSVVLGELWTGFLLGDRTQRNLAELAEFLSVSVTEVLRVDEDVARIYGEIVVDLRNRGRPLPTNDIWIAACAARSGATVLTYDAHFQEIGRIGTQILPRDGDG